MSSKDKKDNKAEQYVRQTGTLGERLGRVKVTRWARFGIVAAIYVAWTVWMGNPWLLLALPLLADIYLTQYVPWGAWKGWKNPVARTVMSWVDAIVYALVLVYFLFLFVGQNYQIPSSSLEKTLLTGDFLWVNKMVYGPRVPQTPLHFPLAQNTLPWLNCKSYIDSPQLAYHRLKGVRGVERGDIVVFNFPAGDTVALNCPNPDYYTLCMEHGREAVWADKATYGEVIYRPVDRRDNYVKRCLGLPGERLAITNGVVSIDGRKLPQPENVQFRHLVITNGTPISAALFDELGISLDDRNGNGQIYELPLTAAMKSQIEAIPQVQQVIPVNDEFLRLNNPEVLTYEHRVTYPVGVDLGWTHENYGPIWIPKKGESITLNDSTVALYERCIHNYEGHTLEQRGGQVLVDGKPATTYTFALDYYWMMGDNRDNSLDSRYWGFVPEDHIVGTPMIVLISFDKDRLNGLVRWDRIFKTPNPDAAAFRAAK